MQPTSRYAGWLPPVADSGGGIGWFPMKATSVAAIFSAVTSTHSTDATPLPGASRNSLVRAMNNDPALIVATSAYVLLGYGASGDRSSSGLPAATLLASLRELANWWYQHGHAVWKRTDWLAAPTGPDSDARIGRFEKLDDYFRNVPLRHWLQQSQAFFDVAGVANPIPVSVRQQWLEHDHAAEHHADQTVNRIDAHRIIAQAVAEHDRSVTRERSFADAIESIRRELAHGLAYGLSHEINNPLANISTRAQTLARHSRDPATSDSLQRIVEQTSRAHAMIADLMFYANPPEPKVQSFDLVERLRRAIRTFAPETSRLGIDVLLVGDVENQEIPVDADPEMIGEAVSVLIRNSIEAIGTDGTIHIRCGVKAIDTGNMARVIVSDSGPGLSPEQAAMAKNPFYSGREAGRGLGLGLCRTDRIAGLHGGTLTLTPALAGCVARFVFRSS